jgi:hypothetical protein
MPAILNTSAERGIIEPSPEGLRDRSGVDSEPGRAV